MVDFAVNTLLPDLETGLELHDDLVDAVLALWRGRREDWFKEALFRVPRRR